MKYAQVILQVWLEEHQIEHKFVLNIHDEYQITCREVDAEIVADLGPKAITAAGELLGFRCPLAGEAHIGTSWKETH